MLYKLGSSDAKFDKLEPVTFKDFSSFGHLEKDLEELIAKSILDVLFEDASLMPIFQERQYQAEADIYALNEKGELIIFELKRGAAGEGAVHQALVMHKMPGNGAMQHFRISINSTLAKALIYTKRTKKRLTLNTHWMQKR